jgi:transposase-like protein
LAKTKKDFSTLNEDDKQWDSLKDCKKKEGIIKQDENVFQFDHGKHHPKMRELANANLKESIRINGLLEKVHAFKEGSTIYIIDGWHRFSACKELGIECPAYFYDDLTDTQKLMLSRDPNIFRRFYTKEEQKAYIVRCHEEGLGYGKIANSFGLTKPTVQRWIKEATKEESSDTQKTEPQTELVFEKAIAEFSKPHKALQKYIGVISETVAFIGGEMAAGRDFSDKDIEQIKPFIDEIDEFISKANEWKDTIEIILDKTKLATANLSGNKAVGRVSDMDLLATQTEGSDEASD